MHGHQHLRFSFSIDQWMSVYLVISKWNWPQVYCNCIYEKAVSEAEVFNCTVLWATFLWDFQIFFYTPGSHLSRPMNVGLLLLFDAVVVVQWLVTLCYNWKAPGAAGQSAELLELLFEIFLGILGCEYCWSGFFWWLPITEGQCLVKQEVLVQTMSKGRPAHELM